MRSLGSISILILLTLGCDAAEPAASDPAPTPAPTTPAPNQGVTPAPAPATPAPVVAAPVVPPPPSAPAPADVCKHVRGVASKDQTQPNLLDEVERDCVVALERVRKQYDTLTSCLLNTSVASDVAACEHSMKSWAGLLAKANPGPTDVKICTHVMDLMTWELRESATMPSTEEMTKIRAKCIEDVAKEREKLGAEEFDAQAKCLMAATKLDELAKCDKDE
jgi:hypothetical protein